MRRSQLPVTALPLWAQLNDVVFYDTRVKDLGSKGFGFETERALSSEASNLDIPTLLHVPKELVLSTEAVEEHAKTDKDFRQLLDAAGGKSTRGDIMLFLLLQITITSPDCPHAIGVSGPWTEYVKMLPSDVPLPTTWTAQERTMLGGTSLELKSALSAKTSVLLKELEDLRIRTSDISWCRKVWWENESLGLQDWILVDSWYRSRCLELPTVGASMVPCLDMANHSSSPNAYYERTNTGDAVLILRPEQNVQKAEEITISYGTTKSAAEMIFSYGFVDEINSKKTMVLNIQPSRDDPLRKAKSAAFGGPPIISLSIEENAVSWSCPFLYFMILNEEDGLEFKVLQETDGSLGQLQTFWKGEDVTNSTDAFQEHIVGHPLQDIFRLRTIALLQDRLGEQIELLEASDEEAMGLQAETLDLVDKMVWEIASVLRTVEADILQKVYEDLESQKSNLLASPVVVKYLGAMDGEGEPLPKDDKVEDEDYS